MKNARKQHGERGATPRRTEVPASEVKNAWHAYLDRVVQGREEVVVTRYGKPIAKLTPLHDADAPETIFGWQRGTVRIEGDIIGPLDEAWEADA